jgi:molybdopterin-guanine dinucleotide biosynthesis protein B
MPPLLHILGGQNHGKTTLIVALVEELSRRGFRVGTIKHSSHAHDLDTPGKDSHRHRQAGAEPAAILTPGMGAVFFRVVPGEDVFSTIDSLYSACDLVLVEGHLDRPGPRVEVWRAAVGTPPLLTTRADIVGLVTDDPIAVRVPTWSRSNVPLLAERLLEQLNLSSAAGVSGERAITPRGGA